MLLNSYEGFDYMDYSRYSMSTKDWWIVFIKSMAATVIIAYLFYDSPIVVIAFPAVFAYCAKLCRQEGVRRQKEKLNEEFMNEIKRLKANGCPAPPPPGPPPGPQNAPAPDALANEPM